MQAVGNFASENLLVILTLCVVIILNALSYWKGHQHGKRKGYKEGHSRGQSVGHRAGHIAGKREGSRGGYKAGKQAGEAAARALREDALDRGEIPADKSSSLIQNIGGGAMGVILIALILLLR